ncbi:unnamed protein product [Clonostachys rosea f. rosea IK726]|uniref:Uncharacterized protein n=1 Tax=Clonostachys rosea f. rosea IK726 TaxID=1349383 RepID=A0ACA9TPZ0_BIOOC|nr:unnamed protein product [Clonostachys rosea f. rosea IK726]
MVYVATIWYQQHMQLTRYLLPIESGIRDDHKLIPNSERKWEIKAFVLPIQEIRRALGPVKLLSAAVLGQEVDLIAFGSSTMPQINHEVDFANVMYHVVIHHTGVVGSKAVVQRYMDRGAPPGKLDPGLPYYVK